MTTELVNLQKWKAAQSTTNIVFTLTLFYLSFAHFYEPFHLIIINNILILNVLLVLFTRNKKLYNTFTLNLLIFFLILIKYHWYHFDDTFYCGYLFIEIYYKTKYVLTSSTALLLIITIVYAIILRSEKNKMVYSILSILLLEIAYLFEILFYLYVVTNLEVL
jgi:hypothetical protein